MFGNDLRLSRIESKLLIIESMLKKEKCEPEACAVCIYGQTAVGTDGKFRIVCGKRMKASCADFTPRRPKDVAAPLKGGVEKVTEKDIQELRQALE